MSSNTQTTDTVTPEVDKEREVAITDTTLQTMMRADLDVQINTAKAYPRSITAFNEEALSIISLSPEIAESCTYAIPRGGKTIEGPSIRFAEIVIASYGNLRVGGRVVMNNGRTVTSQGICHDLEKNTVVTIEVQKSVMQNETKWENGKSVRTGRMVPMNDDLQVLHGNAATSIAIRNSVLKVVPKARWHHLHEMAKRMALGTEATLVERRTKALKYFEEKGISADRICQTLEVKGIDDINLEKLAMLTKFKTALKNNEATLEAIFPPPTPPANKGNKATKAAEDKLKAKGEGKPGEPPTT